MYWSPDGRRFAAVNHHPHPEPSDVRVVDAIAGRELARIKGVRGGVAEFSPNGQLLLTDSGVWEGKNPVRVWNAETGALVATLDGVISARWVRDGRLLTVRSRPDGGQYFAALRNVGEPAPKTEVAVVIKPRANLAPFSSGTRVLRPVSFPVGRLRLSLLQVWDLEAGKSLALLPG